MRLNFASKLYLPIVVTSLIVGVFAYNMKDISVFVNKELKVVSKKELELQKDAKFIKGTLKSMKERMVEQILAKKSSDEMIKMLDESYRDVKKRFEKLKKSSHFQTKQRQKILKNLAVRAKGYYLILKDLPVDFEDSYEDGTYTMLSLISLSKKLDADMSKLQKITREILNTEVQRVVKKKVEFYVYLLVSSLGVLFLVSLAFNSRIINSINSLKKLNHSFLLFVKKQTQKVEKIDTKHITNDEIGDVIKEVSANVGFVERIIKSERELTQEIEDTQKEIIYTMGAIGESRSKETGNHVKRVAEYSYLLAKLYGLSEDEAKLLKEASPMHDIGKVAISDSILKKPGKLTDEEFAIMKTHSQLGYEMLKHSKRPILKAASIIAHQHHEEYNGKGYPQGLKGDEIHIYGAITAVADVFDALGSDRVYKKVDNPLIIPSFFINSWSR